MDWHIAAYYWNEFQEEVRREWSRLTYPQLDLIAGKRVELASWLQIAYGMPDDEAERQIMYFERLNQYRLNK